MEYTMNSFGLQYNRFAPNFTNQYFNNNSNNNNNNNNLVPNSLNQTTNQCYQCSDKPFLQTLIQSDVINPYHIHNAFNQRKYNFQKEFITSSTLPSTSSTKHSSSFTIDSILDTNNTNNTNNENPSIQSPQSINHYSDLNEDSNFGTDSEKNVYNWLRCTRYKPPKVKKRPNNSSDKRKTINRGPRIPFTSFQITELENKFRDTHYLSSLEVNYLANKLNLTDSRIRIWFQNRRARDKREKRSEDLLEKGTETLEEEEGDQQIVVDSYKEEADRESTNQTNYLIDRQKKAPPALHNN